MRDHEMLDAVLSAGSTSPAASSFSRGNMKKSLADELDSAFDDIDLDPINTFELTITPRVSHWEIREDIRKAENTIQEKGEKLSLFQRRYESPAVAHDDPNSRSTPGSTDGQHPTANPAAPGPRRKKSLFIEHLSPTDSSSQPISHKDHIKLVTSKHNRELIERNADGTFKMEAMRSITDFQRRAQQAEGIAALQRTLILPTDAGPGSSSIDHSHASSSMAAHHVKRPSALRKVGFAEGRDRKRDQVQGSHLSARGSKPAPRFSLARDLIASGHKKRLAEPSAPTKFVRVPSDPMVGFKRTKICLAESSLRLSIPHPGLNERERRVSGSITSLPDVDTGGDLVFRDDQPKLHFGTPRHFISDQCLESSCPIRWAHAKGPYHHKGHRHKNILTGLFGHSNPPPEIWNAYRNMINITRDGEIISPNERPRPKVDDDIVIAFATLHYGELNNMTGEEFHRRYAGRHMSSRISVESTSTNSSTGSSSSWVASMIWII